MIEDVSTGRSWARGLPRASREQAARAYFSVRGQTIVDSARLLVGFAVSLLQKSLVPNRYMCVGSSLPGRTPVTVRFAGGVASVRPRTNDLDILVHHEPVTRVWFDVAPGDVVVDVGAHIGLYTLLAAASGARVFALEPDPANRALLEANLRMNGWRDAHVFPVAASDRVGSASLRCADGINRGTSSLAAVQPETSSSSPCEIVPTETLDRLLAPFQLDRIDWLKVDVEGHEAAVLAGACEVLSRTRNLILEVTPATAESCGEIAATAGFRKVAEEPGVPASNWLLVRDGP